MVKEAPSHASEDKARRDVVDLKNQADSLLYQIEKTVNDNRQKIAVGDLSKIETAIANLRTLSQGEDVAAIRKATEELQHVSHAMAEQLYRGQGAQGARGGDWRAGAQGAQGERGCPGCSGCSGFAKFARFAGRVRTT